MPVTGRASFVCTSALRATLYVLLAGLLLAARSHAQSTNGETFSGGTITGHVRGPGDVDVPGATVELIERQTSHRKVTWTDAAGNYTIAGISPGTYRLEVSLVGFRGDVREPVPVAAGKSLKVNVALVIAVPEQSAIARQRRSGAGGDLESLSGEVRERLSALGAGGSSGTSAGSDAASGIP